jgi:hypothetical protein
MGYWRFFCLPTVTQDVEIRSIGSVPGIAVDEATGVDPIEAWRGKEVSHREAAALGLVAGLTAVGLQGRGVGHGERRAVDQEGAGAAGSHPSGLRPAPGVEGRIERECTTRRNSDKPYLHVRVR